MSDAAEFFSRQNTALIVRVPEAEAVVGSWRAEHDASAALGVPAHVTILFPWMPRLRIDEAAIEALTTVFTRFHPFSVRFERVEDQGDVIWLRPEPEDGFRSLTDAVWERWPEFPPYEGQFDDVIPHLTIADGPVEGLLERIASDIGTSLPIWTTVDEIELITFEHGTWDVRDVFALGR